MATLPEEILILIENKVRLERETKEAAEALQSSLDAHYGLLGRFVQDRNGRFRIERVHYRDNGKVFKVSGPKVKKDGSDSQHSGCGYTDYQTGEVVGLEPL